MPRFCVMPTSGPRWREPDASSWGLGLLMGRGRPACVDRLPLTRASCRWPVVKSYGHDLGVSCGGALWGGASSCCLLHKLPH